MKTITLTTEQIETLKPFGIKALEKLVNGINAQFKNIGLTANIPKEDLWYLRKCALYDSSRDLDEKSELKILFASAQESERLQTTLYDGLAKEFHFLNLYVSNKDLKFSLISLSNMAHLLSGFLKKDNINKWDSKRKNICKIVENLNNAIKPNDEIFKGGGSLTKQWGYEGWNLSNSLSDIGILLLISLFIDKDEAKEMLDNLGLKDDEKDYLIQLNQKFLAPQACAINVPITVSSKPTRPHLDMPHVEAFSFRQCDHYKAVLAAFSNMARQSFHVTLIHIYQEVGMLGSFSEGGIADELEAMYKQAVGREDYKRERENIIEDRNKFFADNVRKMKFERCMERHFKFLLPIDAPANAPLATYLQILWHFAKCLHDLRNISTHYDPEEEWQNIVRAQCYAVDPLQKIFDNALDTKDVNDNKKKKNARKNEEEKMRNELKAVIARANGTDDEMFVANFLKGLIPMMGGNCLLPESMGEQENALSDGGLVFLCVLFLSKRYASQMLYSLGMLKDLQGNGSYCPPAQNGAVGSATNQRVAKEQKQSNGQFVNQTVIAEEMLFKYRLRMPRSNKLEMSNDKICLALDMLNELRRCPSPLLPLLSEANQNKFYDLVSSDSDVSNVSEADDAQQPQVDDGKKFTRVRKQDRFPYLALRYIDQNDLLGGIRFQVRLGKYRYEVKREKGKEKNDKQAIPLVLEKEINGYGKLLDIEKARVEKWDAYILKPQDTPENEQEAEQAQNSNSYPYITDLKATYNIIDGGRIGLYWADNSDDDATPGHRFFNNKNLYLPDLPLPEIKDGRTSGSGVDGGVYMPAPKAFLSLHDLAALVYYELRRKEEANSERPSAEKIIKDQYDALRKHFENIHAGIPQENLPISIVPRRIRQFEEKEGEENKSAKDNKILSHLLGTGTSKSQKNKGENKGKGLGKAKHTEGLLGRYLKEIEYKIKDLAALLEDTKKVTPKVLSELARFTAHSIMKWQSPIENGGSSNKGNNAQVDNSASGSPSKVQLTGRAFETLVCKIAHLSQSNRESLQKIMKDKNLIKGHSFLTPALEKFKTKSQYPSSEYPSLVFCKSYLEEEKEKLEGIIYRLETAGENQDDISGILQELPFVNTERDKWKEMDADSVKSLASKYLSNPILLPNSLFTEGISKLGRTIKAKEPEKPGASWFINQHFEQARPPYYKWTRRYPLFHNNVPSIKALGITNPDEMCENDIIEKLKKIDREDINKNIKAEKKKLRYCQQSEKDRFTKSLKEYEEAKAQLTQCEKIEKVIRRYRTQDLILFEMAKSLLIEGSGNKDFEQLSVSNVLNSNMLSKTVPFEYESKVKPYQGKPIGLPAGASITIRQEGVTLKNYGNVRGILRDSRLSTLFRWLYPVLGDNMKKDGKFAFSYTNLKSEFAQYDAHRIEIFETVHDIEKIIIERYKAKYETNKNKIGRLNKAKKKFSDLLVLAIEERFFDQDNKSLTVDTRNSFSHNVYEVDFRHMSGEKQVPGIAKLLLNFLTGIRDSLTAQTNPSQPA